MDQAIERDFDMLYDPTVTRRESSISQYSKRLSITSEVWPSTPLTPTEFIFPRSSYGPSIPIFFDAEDVVTVEGEGGLEKGGSSSSPQGKQNLFERREAACLSAQRPLQPLQDFELNRLSSAYSTSSASSRCLSTDSHSLSSISTAPTEPPSPTPLSPQKVDCSPPMFTVPLPLPEPLPPSSPSITHDRTKSHQYPLLNARRNVPSRPGTAPSGIRQRSFSSSPASSSVPHVPPRPQNSHYCLKRHRPPRSADSTISPPADAFFDPFSPASSRPSTSSTFTDSVKNIPIRLVPPTPTPSDRDRIAKLRSQPLHHAPSSPVLTTKEARTKPLPSLPIFPTRPSSSPRAHRLHPATTGSPTSHARNRSRSEGVYNLPLYPPCVYPPSPPRPAKISPRSSPRVRLASKFSYRHLLRDKNEDSESRSESLPLIDRGGTSEKLVHGVNPELVSFEAEGAKYEIGKTSLQLLIDQEGFRDAKIEFIYTGQDAETGLLEFEAKRPAAGLEREGWPFHVGFLQVPPHLRRLHLDGNDSVDYLRREASLSIGNKDGVYKVSSHSKIDLELAQGGQDIEGPYFSFAYETKRRLNLVGRPMKGERLLRPLVFVCSREFLDPSQGRKIGFKHLVSRTFSVATSASLVVRKQKSVSALKLNGERERRHKEVDDR
ncbi:hypothetical protein JCM3765_000308 [Sporobolomyces pararoseus]